MSHKLLSVTEIFENIKYSQMTAVEASLRLDAVASGGFGISRSKMVSLIEGGNAMVNWIAVKNPAHNIEVNNVVSLNHNFKVCVYLLT